MKYLSANKSIIFWDAHFGPNEGNMPLEKLKKNKQLKLLKKIVPPQPFKVLGGYNYAIYVFQKLPKVKHSGSHPGVISDKN